ncbi:hypothetical protein AXG93_1504s1000 [Marchantia polymorpha subsp. ruderalis]|uniref:RWD domain-containing protein n=1 Tax=Marchantia polymorpha subsp. ruderalis TaxID=1480154 RepID=A0A176VN29_MARPO|nr:hypothetical protein AXG93_1504s1000 [Marchantia polymorpha subsp. ruderalis]
MADYAEEQEMEIDALQAILMDDIVELNSNESGLHTTARCFQITISPKDDDEDEPTDIPVRLALVFAHTPNYPDEPPLFDVRSLQGVKVSDVKELKERLQKEATENLGMAMIYTLHTSAKEWLREKFGQDQGDFNSDDEDDIEKEDIIEPHGEAVTVETFLAWRERYEAELALEKAKLMPEAALLASKEKRMSGRAWFESGRASASVGFCGRLILQKGAKIVAGDSEEELEEEDLDFDDDFDDEDLDEEDMLDHFLSGRSDKTPVRS